MSGIDCWVVTDGAPSQEALSRVTFSQVPTCHVVSPFTASPERLDIIVGFASGDLVWLDFIVGRYSRINKGGILNGSAVTSVHFDPRHPHHFIASFADSTVLQFNMFAEDPVLPPSNSTTPMPWTVQFERQEEASLGSGGSVPMLSKYAGDGETEKSVPLDTPANGSTENATPADGQATPVPQVNGQMEMDGEERLLKWKNDDFGSLAELSKVKKGEERGTWVGKNPIAAFKIVKQGLNGVFTRDPRPCTDVISSSGILSGRTIPRCRVRGRDAEAGGCGRGKVSRPAYDRLIALTNVPDCLTYSVATLEHSTV